jgi:anti-sigma factor (TIGR02949 family)
LKCRDALRLLYDVVDKEAGENEMAEFQEHIKKCHKCSARYEMEQRFKDCVERKGRFSPECEDLKQKIYQQLDAIDQDGGEADLFSPPMFES